MIRVLALEVFGSINKSNPVHTQNLFEKYVRLRIHKDDLKRPISNYVTFGDKCARRLKLSHVWKEKHYMQNSKHK